MDDHRYDDYCWRQPSRLIQQSAEVSRGDVRSPVDECFCSFQYLPG